LSIIFWFLGILPLLLIFILIIFAIMKVDSNKLYRVYLAVVSFVSVIAIAITLWVVLTALWKFLIISDEEYIEHSRSYELRQCEEPKLTTGQDQRVERTQEEIDECIIKATESAVKARRFNLKDMFISSWAWMIVFVIVFIFHYPKFLKSRD